MPIHERCKEIPTRRRHRSPVRAAELEETAMTSIRKYALGLAFLLVTTAGSTARAQTGEGTI
jgi:hypothetical protein